MKADLVMKNGWIVTPEATTSAAGVAISDGKIRAIGRDDTLPDGKQVIDAKGHARPSRSDRRPCSLPRSRRDPQGGLRYRSTAAVCGGITTVVDMPNQIPPTENAEQVGVKKKIAESKSMCDFAVLGVVHQTNADDILPMAKAGAIGYKIFFGETIGNLPFPDDGMCIEVFSNITKSGVPLCVHAENRQIQHYWTNKLKAEGKNDPILGVVAARLCEAESIAHIMSLAETFGTKLHIVHASTKQAVQMVKDAKARGLRSLPKHSRTICCAWVDTDMKDVGPLLKMNPPVRKEHQDALWQGPAGRLDRHDRDRPLSAYARGKGLRHQRQDGEARDLGLHLRILRRRDLRSAAHAGEQGHA